MTASTVAKQIPRPRAQRGSLSREKIVRASLRLLDAEGVAGFSLPKLGRALGTDPTAVYRHFASKDDLVLAIADRLIAESSGDLVPSDCWMSTLAESTRRLRSTYIAHPAAASLASYRTTQGPAEMHIVNIIIGAVLQAGFEGAEAALAYRAMGDFALSWAGCEAAFLALDERLQKNDRGAWTSAYLAADRATYPHIWQVRMDLPDVDDNEIFETILALVIDGLAQRAPRPCGCAEHAKQGTAPTRYAPRVVGHPGRRPGDPALSADRRTPLGG